MRGWFAVLAMVLLSPIALAQDKVAADQASIEPMQAQSQPHIISANEMHKPPSMRPIGEALVRSGLSSVSTSVSLIWDASGNVTNLKLDKPTGSKQLDRAILGWAAKIQLNAQEPGEGTLRLTMQL